MPQAISDLVGHTIFLGGMAPGKFLPVLEAFGPLPDEGQLELAERLAGGVGKYRLAIRMKGPRPSEERDQLKLVARLAGTLLEQLVGDDSQARTDLANAQPRSLAGALMLVELYKVAMERRPTASTLTASERWRHLCLLLSDLQEAAERCAPKALQRSPRESERRGRGGKGRRGSEPKGALLDNLFETYAALRQRFPTSGPPLASNKKLRAFVRAGLALAGSSAPPMIASDGKQYEFMDKACGPDLSKESTTTDEAIKKAFERWKRQSKPRQTFDLGLAAKKRGT